MIVGVDALLFPLANSNTTIVAGSFQEQFIYRLIFSLLVPPPLAQKPNQFGHLPSFQPTKPYVP
jgi:hypothetical protein